MRIDDEYRLAYFRLVALLYVLMRDSIPLGELEKAMLIVESLTAEPNFSSAGLEHHAREVADRIGFVHARGKKGKIR